MIRSAHDILGAPYEVGGRGPRYDCAGVVAYALPDLASEIEGLASGHSAVAAAVGDAEASGRWEEVGLVENALVTISRNGYLVPHIGVYQRGRVIHATMQVEVRADPPALLRRAGWRFLRGYRFQGARS